MFDFDSMSSPSEELPGPTTLNDFSNVSFTLPSVSPNTENEEPLWDEFLRQSKIFDIVPNKNINDNKYILTNKQLLNVIANYRNADLISLDNHDRGFKHLHNKGYL